MTSTNDLVFEALTNRKRGSEAFATGDFEKCISRLEKAIEIVNDLPAEVDFDKPIFLACCRAELSGAYGSQKRYIDAIKTAEAALNTFKPIGLNKLASIYPNEANYYFAAAFNLAQSTYGLGKLDDAQDAFLEAARIYKTNNYQLSESDRQAMRWRKMCFEMIEDIEKEKRSS